MPTEKEGCSLQKFLLYLRYVVSTIISLTMFAIVTYGIANGHAVLPGSPLLHFLILLSTVTLLAFLEGLQVAILALENIEELPSAWEVTYPRGVRMQRLTRQGNNVSRFLVGRQFFVIFVVFLAAQITTFPTFPRGDVPNWLFTVVIQTGLPGALIYLACGQLMPQLVAQTDPIYFLSLPGVPFVIHLALTLETIGITHFSWVLTFMTLKACKLPRTDPTAAFRKSSDDDDVKTGLLDKLQSKSVMKDLFLPEGDLDEELIRAFADEGLGSTEMGSAERRASWQQSIQMWRFAPAAKNVYSPYAIANHLVKQGQPVARFLLPPEHPQHIPPHLVAYELMTRTSGLQMQIQLLEQQLNDAKGERSDSSIPSADAKAEKTNGGAKKIAASMKRRRSLEPKEAPQNGTRSNAPEAMINVQVI